MKATKLILIVAFLSFAAMGYSKADIDQGPLTAKITLENAITKPALVAAMHQQLTPAILHKEYPGRLITAKVVLRRTTYLISGSRAAWKEFFKMRLVEDPEA